jgi:hypothetical protein
MVSSSNVRFLLRFQRLDFGGGALQASAGHGTLAAVIIRRKARPTPTVLHSTSIDKAFDFARHSDVLLFRRLLAASPLMQRVLGMNRYKSSMADSIRPTL